nr:hypothetical protein [Streptomyces sasae]
MSPGAGAQVEKPEQTANELLSALRVSSGEVRDRPAIRQIVHDLSTRHPQVSGVGELAAAAGVRGWEATASMRWPERVYVSRGAGAWGPPTRVGAPSDITVIELASRRA